MIRMYNEIKQGTKEWHDIRKLHFTASNANTILAQGKGLDTLIRTMLAQYFSSGNYEEYTDDYQSSAMRRGVEFEDKARTIYELETGNQVIQTGFIECDKHIGCSPDGLIGEEGLLEIKNLGDKHFFQLKIDKQIEKKHLDQMQMQMFVSHREWCDYFVFNPNYDEPFVLIRVNRDEEYMSSLDKALTNAVSKLKAEKERLEQIFKKGVQNGN